MRSGKIPRQDNGKNIAVVHGPNLNLLGEREPDVYGTMTLKDLNNTIRTYGRERGCTMKFYQSNSEGELIDFIQSIRKWADALIINPAAYTHYSYAIRDAISSISVPTYEVHLSDIRKREKFRRISVIQEVCVDQISGLGWKSYIKAIDRILESKPRERHHGR